MPAHPTLPKRLKIGGPMVAAAPLLLALNVMSGPALACTGSANDPVHCANNNGQAIDGFGTFYSNNLEDVTGATPFTNDDDAGDFNFIVPLELPTYVVRQRADGTQYSDTLNSGSTDEVVEVGQNSRQNFTVGAGFTPMSFSGVEGTPQLPGQTGAPTNFSTFYSTSGNQFQPAAGATPGTSITVFVNADGNLSVSSQTFVNALPQSFQSGSCSAGAPASCGAELDGVYNQLSEAIDPDDLPAILSMVPNDDDNDLSGSSCCLSSPYAIENERYRQQFVTTPPDEDDDTSVVSEGADLYAEFYTDDDDAAPTVDDSKPFSPPAEYFNDDDDAQIGGPLYLTPEGREIANDIAGSLDRLRTEIENESDPDRKAELESRLQRRIATIQAFGTNALRHSVLRQDSQTAPVPRR